VCLHIELSETLAEQHGAALLASLRTQRDTLYTLVVKGRRKADPVVAQACNFPALKYGRCTIPKY
jgi:hypothetical protein